jgi:hypothetical protein
MAYGRPGQLQSPAGTRRGRCKPVAGGRVSWERARTTFIIDPDGKVAEILRKVKPAEHDKLVLKALARAPMTP